MRVAASQAYPASLIGQNDPNLKRVHITKSGQIKTGCIPSHYQADTKPPCSREKLDRSKMINNLKRQYVREKKKGYTKREVYQQVRRHTTLVFLLQVGRGPQKGEGALDSIVRRSRGCDNPAGSDRPLGHGVPRGLYASGRCLA